jgi:8-oxo-dGTP pyrophosphatase MutT (NUDIX family)
MKVSRVITCFLKYGERILILKRSSEVNSYQGKWGGVSGYVEEGRTPEETGIMEIEEETGIKKDGVVLLRKGKNFKFVDKDVGRAWAVHPYLYETKTDNIRLNWEHEKYKWIRPPELANYDTVPELERSLRNVL